MDDRGGHVTVRVGAVNGEPEGGRVADQLSRQGDGNGVPEDAAIAALSEHTAVALHGVGTSSGALANFIECFSSYAQGRVLGTGHEQYAAHGPDDFVLQKFEADSLADLIDGALEELADLSNYAAMSAIKLLAVRRRFVK